MRLRNLIDVTRATRLDFPTPNNRWNCCSLFFRAWFVYALFFLPSHIGRNLCGILEIFSPILWSTLLRSWTFFHCFPRSIFNALHLFDSLKTVRGFCYKRLLTACRAWWVMRFRIGAWRSELLFAVRTAGDKLKQQIWRWFKSKLFSNIFISFEKALTAKPNITTC